MRAPRILPPQPASMLHTSAEPATPTNVLLWPVPRVRPTLKVDEVHVWAASLDQPVASERALESLLSLQELNRAERFRSDRDRRRYVVAHGILRRVLASYRQADPKALRFTIGKNGKPALSDESGPTALRFNLSHTEDMTLIALTLGRELGVDVECVRPISELDSIVEIYFTSRERDMLRTMDDTARRDAFYRCWTRKESYAKATGGDLSVALRGFDSMLSSAPADRPALDAPREPSGWNLHDLLPADGYVGAVAINGPVGRLLSWQWTQGTSQ
jgi:4'-phosphopantetheinyl transferase